MSTELFRFLKTHADKGTVSFHMPGHKGSQLYKRFGYTDFLHDFLDFDITEIYGADNLFQAEGILKNIREIYAGIYEVPRSYLLINGTSGGIIASILACVPKGKKLLMARNCHKSVFNALALGDIKPVYAYPDVLTQWGISGAISPDEIERLLYADPNIEAVILPSPNYYGICSDIAAIAKVVHSYEKILIVDQAHGAHLKFFSKIDGMSKKAIGQQVKKGDMSFPKSAEEQGADIVINSIHKTLASMTQSAVLNLATDRADHYMLEDKLQMIQSTSPSYILMASLDINADLIQKHGELLIRQWQENLSYFYDKAQKIDGLCVMSGLEGLDHTKINLDMSALGLSGAKLEKLLLDDDIFVELSTGNIVMCMTGIGNKRSDYTKLLDALSRIADQKQDLADMSDLPSGISASAVYSISQAKSNTISGIANAKLYDVPKDKRRIRLSEAAGHIAAISVIPYPPGIPMICPGEIIEQHMIEHIKQLRAAGEKVIGVTESDEIWVDV